MLIHFLFNMEKVSRKEKWISFKCSLCLFQLCLFAAVMMMLGQLTPLHTLRRHEPPSLGPSPGSPAVHEARYWGAAWKTGMPKPDTNMERCFGELCQSFAAYVRETARLWDQADLLANAVSEDASTETPICKVGPNTLCWWICPTSGLSTTRGWKDLKLK